jgi:hypothetical protein
VFGVGRSLEQSFDLIEVSAKTVRHGKLKNLASTGAWSSRSMWSKFWEVIFVRYRV